MRSASIELRVTFADLDGMRAVYHTNLLIQLILLTL